MMISCSSAVYNMLIKKQKKFLLCFSTVIIHFIHRINRCICSHNKDFATYYHFHSAYYYKSSNLSKPF